MLEVSMSRRASARWMRSGPLALGVMLVMASARPAATQVVVAPEVGLGGGVTVQQAIAAPWAAPFPLTLHSGEKRVLHNCAELFPVTKLIAPVFGDDLLRLETLTARCIVLRALRDNKPADRSFVSDYRLDAAGWKISPPVFDYIASPDAVDRIHKAERLGQSAADLEQVRIKPIDPLHARVHGDKWDGDFTILVRGLDLNNDGIEDLIVIRKVTPSDGPPNFVFMSVTRTAPMGPLRLFNGYPVEALGLLPAAPSAPPPPVTHDRQP